MIKFVIVFLAVMVVNSRGTTIFSDDFNGSSINQQEWEFWDLDAKFCAGNGGEVLVGNGNAAFRCINEFGARVGITMRKPIDLRGKTTRFSSTHWNNGNGLTTGIGFLEMDFGNFSGNAHCDSINVFPFIQHTISYKYGHGTSIFGEANGDTNFNNFRIDWNAANIIYEPVTYNVIFIPTAEDPKIYVVKYEWIKNGVLVHDTTGYVNLGKVDPSHLVFGYSIHHYPAGGEPWNGDCIVDKIVISQEPMIDSLYFPQIVFTDPVFSNPNIKTVETTTSVATLAGQVLHRSAPLNSISLLVNRLPIPITLNGDHFSASFSLIKGPNYARIRVADENTLFSEEVVLLPTPIMLFSGGKNMRSI